VEGSGAGRENWIWRRKRRNGQLRRKQLSRRITFAAAMFWWILKRGGVAQGQGGKWNRVGVADEVRDFTQSIDSHGRAEKEEMNRGNHEPAELQPPQVPIFQYGGTRFSVGPTTSTILYKFILSPNSSSISAGLILANSLSSEC